MYKVSRTEDYDCFCINIKNGREKIRTISIDKSKSTVNNKRLKYVIDTIIGIVNTCDSLMPDRIAVIFNSIATKFSNIEKLYDEEVDKDNMLSKIGIPRIPELPEDQKKVILNNLEYLTSFVNKNILKNERWCPMLAEMLLGNRDISLLEKHHGYVWQKITIIGLYNNMAESDIDLLVKYLIDVRQESTIGCKSHSSMNVWTYEFTSMVEELMEQSNIDFIKILIERIKSNLTKLQIITILYGMTYLHEDITEYISSIKAAKKLYYYRKACSNKIPTMMFPLFDGNVYHDTQMKQIIAGILEGVDVVKYANPSFEWKEMKSIRLSLRHKKEEYKKSLVMRESYPDMILLQLKSNLQEYGYKGDMNIHYKKIHDICDSIVDQLDA